MRPNGFRKNVPKCQAPYRGEEGGEGQDRAVPPPLKMLSGSLERSVFMKGKSLALGMRRWLGNQVSSARTFLKRIRLYVT